MIWIHKLGTETPSRPQGFDSKAKTNYSKVSASGYRGRNIKSFGLLGQNSNM